MLAWKGFFYTKIDDTHTGIPGSLENFPAIMRSFSILIGYIVLFVGAAIVVFKKKDILS
jgi:ABC-2 type transport system permease protein